MHNMPKVIWMLWLQGWENAPEIVSACAATWAQHNPDWTIHLLARETIRDYLGGSPHVDGALAKSMPPEALSDILRMELLYRFGGVWIDSTVYCLKPLDDWIHDVVSEGFFAFERPGPDRMVSSWFLAAEKGSPIIEAWRDSTVEYWIDRADRHHYFWLHYLFNELYESDKRFRAVWDRTPKISAIGACYFVLDGQKLLGPTNDEDRRFVALAQAPLVKLSHKLDLRLKSETSNYDYLCARAHVAAEVGRRLPDDQRVLAPVRRSRVKHLLVLWYGSLPGAGTIGDLYAARSVAAHLLTRGHSFAHVTDRDDLDILGTRLSLNGIDHADVDAVIFVCGPIISHHVVEELISRFASKPKIGVGVSLFPSDHPNYSQPFDVVLAREGAKRLYADIAIAAPHVGAADASFRRVQRSRIGIVLRGLQGEYRPENSLHRETENIVGGLISIIRQTYDFETVEIEHRLGRTNRPSDIEEAYAGCRMVITSRYHGAICALRHGVPFIAIDQIKGGAKVSRLLGPTNWPYVYRTEHVSVDKLADAATHLLTNSSEPELRELANRARTGAEETLATMDAIIDKI